MVEEPTGRCLRCGAGVRKVAWNADASVYFHSAIVGVDPSGIPVVCGGEVVPREEAAPGPRPGQVLPCQSVSPSFRVHLVRLGRLCSRRNGSWRGTALCGATPGGLAHWLPTPGYRDSADLCEVCAMARGAGLAD